MIMLLHRTQESENTVVELNKKTAESIGAGENSQC